MATRGNRIALVLAVLVSGYFAGEAIVALTGIALILGGVDAGEAKATQALLGPVVLAGLLVWALVQPRLGRMAIGLAVFSVASLTAIHVSSSIA